jgi:ATP-dependent DNA helicase DinG
MERTEYIVPDSPAELGLPHKVWRPHQREAVQAIVDAFLLHGHRVVLLGAPTGSGKSLIGAAVQAVLGKKAMIATHTRQLQQQYLATIPNARTLMGRANFKCELPLEHEDRGGLFDLTADEAVCAEGKPCPIELDGPGGCGYYAQLWNAADAPAVVTNYAYLIRILRTQGFKRRDGEESSFFVPNPFRRPLLVADEAHLLEHELLNAASIQISERLFRNIGVPFPPRGETQFPVQEGPRTISYYECPTVWYEWLAKALPALSDYYDRIPKDEEKKRKSIKKLYKRLTEIRLLLSDERRDEVFHVTRRRLSGGEAISITPLWGNLLGYSSLWRHFDYILLMTATPGNPRLLAFRLGIPEASLHYYEMPSTFPRENRPVYFMPVASLSHRSTNEDWLAIASKIVSICRTFPATKGMVHSVSYEHARRLAAIMQLLDPQLQSRLLVHDSPSANLQELLNRFVNSTDPLVFVSPSLTHGIDLPHVFAWQVIAKVPYPNLGDELVRRRQRYKYGREPIGQQIYLDDTMSTIVQASGRVVRTPTDKGVTFILDANYEKLHRIPTTYKPRFYLDAFQRLC